jgi:endogenous inhibitor of DNA gyrase (YacG/DUF329 family)
LSEGIVIDNGGVPVRVMGTCPNCGGKVYQADRLVRLGLKETVRCAWCPECNKQVEEENALGDRHT